MIIRSRAPLRLGLAGGGTDVPPYSSLYGGNVLNVTIDKFAYTTIKYLREPLVRFGSTDQGVSFTRALDSIECASEKLILHSAVYNHVIKNFNNGVRIPLEVTTYCDAPIGSGLGSSSTLVVSLLKAYVELLNLPLDDYGIANHAYVIERIDCGLDGGMQDQYAAAFGGFNFIEFNTSGQTIVNPLRIKNWVACELESSILMYFTGVSRQSAGIISDQSKNLGGGNSIALEAMHDIKREAVEMKDALLRADFGGIVDCLKRGWKNKKELSRIISNEWIDQIHDDACRNGALAGKISGAGGGGFMMFYVPLERRSDVINTLKKYGGEVELCGFAHRGCQAWKLQGD